MKSLSLVSVLTAVAFSLFANASIAQSSDEIDKQGIVEVTLTKIPTTKPITFTMAQGLGVCDDTRIQENPILDEVTGVGLVIDEIINIGKKVWNIIEMGRPVVNIKTDVGTALPKGAKCWLDLQNWSIPQTQTYQAVFKNGFGASVVNLQFQVVSIAGGSVEGHGKYIGYATIIPTQVDVSWGYKLNANVTVQSVYNMGTKADPIAGMQLQMSYMVDTVLKHSQTAHAFFISGNNEIKQLK